jgi:hypothetical protein
VLASASDTAELSFARLASAYNADIGLNETNDRAIKQRQQIESHQQPPHISSHLPIPIVMLQALGVGECVGVGRERENDRDNGAENAGA